MEFEGMCDVTSFVGSPPISPPMMSNKVLSIDKKDPMFHSNSTSIKASNLD